MQTWCSHVQSVKLVHMSGVRCHIRASSTRSCAFVYFPVAVQLEDRNNGIEVLKKHIYTGGFKFIEERSRK